MRRPNIWSRNSQERPGVFSGMREYRIGLASARDKIETGDALVLDVTSPFVQPAVHSRIHGALPVDPRQILDTNRPASEVLAKLPSLPRDRTIIAYCTCPNEMTSARVAHFLQSQGFDAWALQGGLSGWRAAGYPLRANGAGHRPPADAPDPECGEPVSAHAAV
jgi:rhodanese-related sulfurtransferase